MLRENVDFSAVTCQVWLPGFVAMLSQERVAGGLREEGTQQTVNGRPGRSQARHYRPVRVAWAHTSDQLI